MSGRSSKADSFYQDAKWLWYFSCLAWPGRRPERRSRWYKGCPKCMCGFKHFYFLKFINLYKCTCLGSFSTFNPLTWAINHFYKPLCAAFYRLFPFLLSILHCVSYILVKRVFSAAGNQSLRNCKLDDTEAQSRELLFTTCNCKDFNEWPLLFSLYAEKKMLLV